MDERNQIQETTAKELLKCGRRQLVHARLTTLFVFVIAAALCLLTLRTVKVYEEIKPVLAETGETAEKIEADLNSISVSLGEISSTVEGADLDRAAEVLEGLAGTVDKLEKLDFSALTEALKRMDSSVQSLQDAIGELKGFFGRFRF